MIQHNGITTPTLQDDKRYNLRMASRAEPKPDLLPSLKGEDVRSVIPLTTRLAIEIPKPKDWQAFQRNCVLLFRAELNDRKRSA
jgi:hypothetical protein